jgi:uncharacterized phage protein (TIGR02218 family)
MPSALATHLASPVTSISTGLLLIRPDGTRFGFTDHDQPIDSTSVTQWPAAYRGTYSPSFSYTTSAARSTSDGSVGGLETQGVLDSEAITESDLEAGRFDNSAVYMFIFNWADLTNGINIRKTGTIGKVTIGQNQFKAELRGLLQYLQTIVGRTVQPTCDADLGDSRCTINLTARQVSDTVATVQSHKQFTGTGLTQPGPVVKSYTSSKITFQRPTAAGEGGGLIIDGANGFGSAGFLAGDTILIQGSARNDGPGLIKSLAVVTGSGVMTMVQNDPLILTERTVEPVTLTSIVLGYFDLGHVQFTSGLNSGLRSEVRSYSGPTAQSITFFLDMPYDIAPGDTYDIFPGCDHRIQTCVAKFSNAINFRGFFSVPGQNALWVYPNGNG